MRDLQSLRVFLVVYRLRSFSQAARHLSMTAAAVTRAISALEKDLGTQLFLRSTRVVQPTRDGTALAVELEPVLADLDRTLNTARRGAPSGQRSLKLSLPMAFGTRFMGDIVASFQALHPDVALQCDLSDSFVDIVAEGYDMGLRITDMLQGGSTITRKLMTLERHLIAAPDAPETRLTDPDDIAPHRRLGHAQPGGSQTWHLSCGKRVRRLNAGETVVTNNGDQLASLVAAGLGAALMPNFITLPLLRARQVTRICQNWQPHPLFAILVYPPYDKLPPLVAALSEHIEQNLPRL